MIGTCAFAAEVSEDRERCSVGAVWRQPPDAGGRIVFELAWRGRPSAAAAEVGRMYAEHSPVKVVVDGRSQSATLLEPLREAGVVAYQPTTQEVVIAHANFMDLLAAGELVHLGQPELTEAVRSARRRPLAGALAWERRVPVDQSPLVACTLALWAYLKHQASSAPSAWLV